MLAILASYIGTFVLHYPPMCMCAFKPCALIQICTQSVLCALHCLGMKLILCEATGEGFLSTVLFFSYIFLVVLY